jgi:hypothetical protein
MAEISLACNCPHELLALGRRAAFGPSARSPRRPLRCRSASCGNGCVYFAPGSASCLASRRHRASGFGVLPRPRRTSSRRSACRLARLVFTWLDNRTAGTVFSVRPWPNFSSRRRASRVPVPFVRLGFSLAVAIASGRFAVCGSRRLVSRRSVRFRWSALLAARVVWACGRLSFRCLVRHRRAGVSSTRLFPVLNPTGGALYCVKGPCRLRPLCKPERRISGRSFF